MCENEICENEMWEENGVIVEIVVGFSGTYRIETDVKTGEILRDDRPWQMKMGVS